MVGLKEDRLVAVPFHKEFCDLPGNYFVFSLAIGLRFCDRLKEDHHGGDPLLPVNNIDHVELIARDQLCVCLARNDGRHKVLSTFLVCFLDVIE